jgi:hypothetical protein
VVARDLAGFDVDVIPVRWGRYSDFTPKDLEGPTAGPPGPLLPGLLPGAYVARSSGGSQADKLGLGQGITWTLHSVAFGFRPSAGDVGYARLPLPCSRTAFLWMLLLPFTSPYLPSTII